MISMPKNKLVAILLSFVFIFSCVYSFADAQKDLNDGISLYDKGNYDAAMDKFIDVMMQGTAEQHKTADEYVNKIHNKMGGIEEPKFISYADEAAAAQQNVKAQAAATKAAAEAQVAADKAAAQQYYSTQTQALQQAYDDASATAGETYSDITATASSAPAAASSAAVTSVNSVTGAKRTVYSGATTSSEGTAVVSAEPVYYMGVDPHSSAAKTLRAQLTDEKIIDMRNAAIESIQKTKGVKLHIRNGLPDALDIAPGVLFDGNSKFIPSSKKLMDDIFMLMVLSAEPTFVVMPPGSYTDDVNLKGVKQAMTFSTAMVYRGLSPAKITYNMGLADEVPSDKFSNIDGLGVVFDYNTAPSMQMPDAKQSPLMSLAILPLTQKIVLNDKEGFLMDFSVIETTSPVGTWQLQVIQQNKDGKYYIMRQIEGSGPVYAQAYSNGRKLFFGDKLAPGRYIVSLKASDSAGHTRTLRRSVTLLADGTTVKTTSSASGASYKDAYLWAKPGRINVSPLMVPAEHPDMSAGGEDIEYPNTQPTDYGSSTYGDYGSYGSGASSTSSYGTTDSSQYSTTSSTGSSYSSSYSSGTSSADGTTGYDKWEE